jgi:L-rhamnose-H+ transport protein
MAVAVAIVSGLVCLTGSLIPILAFNPADLFRTAGVVMLVGMPVLLGGLVLYGQAATLRSREQGAAQPAASKAGMSFKVGLALAIFTGLTGSAWNIGFVFSGDLLHRAAQFGATPATATYASWAIILSGGLLPNLLYPVYLLWRRGTWRSFNQGNWPKELALGLAMAVIWLTAILTYGVGTTYVGKFGTSLGFALYTASTILASSCWGIATGEWRDTSLAARRRLAFGMATVLASVLILNLGGLFPSGR